MIPNYILTQLKEALQALERALQSRYPMPPAPKPPPPPAPKKQYALEDLMLAMRDFEGSPGDLNYQNNNPLNCRCSRVGYLPIYGAVQCVQTKSGKFAKFSTYQLGWLYAKNLIKQKIQKHPKWTIFEFIGDPVEGWSPAADNNPVNQYAQYIGKHLGVDPYFFCMSSLV